MNGWRNSILNDFVPNVSKLTLVADPDCLLTEAELIGGEVDLLRALLRVHYGKLQLPMMLAERLIQVLRGHDKFKAWPLSEIVPDDEAFFAFLQERWPLFLSAQIGVRDAQEEVRSAECGVREDETRFAPGTSHFRFLGPREYPFGHQDILVYLDNLFLEGKLKPVDVAAFEKEAKRILNEVEKECGWMYETLHTDRITKGELNYTIWSDVFVCSECASEVVFGMPLLMTNSVKS